jgi:drug/metabolite transporter (DMT)-like permease
VIATIKGVTAGTGNVAFALLLGATVPSLAAIAGAAVVGFLGVGVSLVLFMLALSHLGTARTGAYFSPAPFIGAVIAIGLPGVSLHPTWDRLAGSFQGVNGSSRAACR